jgi:aminocarboxymuconate-semialdehyde decarboxylase
VKSLVIDVHAHYVPSLAFERFDRHAAGFAGVRLARSSADIRMQFPDAEMTRPISPKLSNLAERRAWMDQNRIDHQLLGLWTDVEGYELVPQEGLAWSRFVNDCMLEELRGETRFTPLASVPLQDGALAATVLQDALAQGFAGAMIGTQPHGSRGGNLDDPSLDPFWEAASRLGAALFLHPMFLCGEPRLADYDLVNVAGRLADSTIAVARLLFSGHLLRFPGVKLVIAHGGAALPYAMGRLGRNFDAFPGKYADPRKGFEALLFDSCVFESAALEYLARRAGHDRIMLGSDMPFPIGDPRPTRVIESAALSDAQRQAMLSETAQKVFRIRPDRWTRA